MTMQIRDSFQHQNKAYTIVDLSASIPFDPSDYGLQPHSCCTACWRGHWCTYTSANDRLLLKELYLFNKDGNYPTLNGKDISPQEMTEYLRFAKDDTTLEPVLCPAHYGHRVYEDVNLPIRFSGKLLIGRDPTDTHYIYRIQNIPWRYKDLVELVFEAGVLTDVLDHSHTAKDIRKLLQTMAKSSPESHGTRGTFVRMDLGIFDLIGADFWWIRRRGR